VWNAAQKDDAWFKLELKASSTGLISQDELKAAEADMGRDHFAQEFECSFEAALKGAFYADELERAQNEKRITWLPTERSVKVHTAWDLGVTDSTAIWFVQCVGKERRLIDYYETSGVGLDHYVEVLEDKGYLYGDHYFPHDIEVRELTTGASRVDTLRGLGIAPTVVPQAAVMDGINAVRRLLDSCWIDPDRCARGLEALKQYRREWDERLKDWRMRPRHDWSSHGADALRTFAMGFEDQPAVKKPAAPRPRWFSQAAQSWLGG
jgi:phage terminase large subunit